MKKRARSLTPAKLRLILLVTLTLILLASGGVFYLAYRHLSVMADDVGQKVAEANASQNTIQELEKLKQELDENQEAINKASQITADGQNYSYQDQIVSDLTTYADRSGMKISNITFSTGSGATAGAPAGTEAGAGAAPAAAAPAGLKTTAVSVSLESPADYRGLLNFLHYIEQNLTKLKIANVTLTKSDDDKVNTDVLSLEVYLR